MREEFSERKCTQNHNHTLQLPQEYDRQQNSYAQPHHIQAPTTAGYRNCIYSGNLGWRQQERDDHGLDYGTSKYCELYGSPAIQQEYKRQDQLPGLTELIDVKIGSRNVRTIPNQFVSIPPGKNCAESNQMISIPPGKNHTWQVIWSTILSTMNSQVMKKGV